MAVLPAAVHQRLTHHGPPDDDRLAMLQGVLDSDAFPGHVRDAYRLLRHLHCEAPAVQGVLMAVEHTPATRSLRHAPLHARLRLWCKQQSKVLTIVDCCSCAPVYSTTHTPQACTPTGNGSPTVHTGGCVSCTPHTPPAPPSHGRRCCKTGRPGSSCCRACCSSCEPLDPWRTTHPVPVQWSMSCAPCCP